MNFFLQFVLLERLTAALGEWFSIGSSPWGNPQTSQPGMFAYWACMALVPLAFWVIWD